MKVPTHGDELKIFLDIYEVLSSWFSRLHKLCTYLCYLCRKKSGVEVVTLRIHMDRCLPSQHDTDREAEWRVKNLEV